PERRAQRRIWSTAGSMSRSQPAAVARRSWNKRDRCSWSTRCRNNVGTRVYLGSNSWPVGQAMLGSADPAESERRKESDEAIDMDGSNSDTAVFQSGSDTAQRSRRWARRPWKRDLR